MDCENTHLTNYKIGNTRSAYALGPEEAHKALVEWLGGLRHVVLVTGGASYACCGAETFLKRAFEGFADLKVTHLVVTSANPKVEMAQFLLNQLSSGVDGFLSIGGGTVIDTAKLLNLAYSVRKNIRQILDLDEVPKKLLPSFAMPTTAGTGAEATRFAVCYDGEKKFSVDYAAIKPGVVAIVSDFSASLPAYQKASTHFDAYAQAVESLWARSATEESKTYGKKALDLMKIENWSEASYWAGRAIDISRTTAAHAFSYYLTSHYGIPHGHAVYMMFPYVCRANGHPEYIRHVQGLSTFDQFVVEKGLDRAQLIDELFENVNPARLGNNPCEVRKEHFNG